MGVPVLVVMVMVGGLAGPERQAGMTVRPMVVVLMGPQAVAVRERAVHTVTVRLRRIVDAFSVRPGA